MKSIIYALIACAIGIAAIGVVANAAYAEESNNDDNHWSNAEIAKESVALTLLAVDWGQTRTIAASRRFKENNWIEGSHPSEKGVNRYFAIAVPLQIVTADQLPRKYRNMLIDGTIAVEVVCVAHNRSIGIAIKF